MNFNDVESLKKNGFNGFKKIEELWQDKNCIPKVKGVYFILNPNYSETEFVYPGVGGFYKARDPNVPTAELQKHFIPDSLVMFIDKAGSPSGKATLNSRLGQFLRFGRTRRVDYWNGRYLWQIKDHAKLVCCWKETPNEDPLKVAQNYTSEFIKVYGRKPFANSVS